MAISLSTGNKLITPELYSRFMESFHTTFIICTALCVAGIYTSSFRNKTGR
jgi:hypothetical protein